MLGTAKKYFKRRGSTVNVENTKIMVFGQERKTQSEWFWERERIEEVKINKRENGAQ